MQISTKHVGLIAGILAVLLSFLFFGRQQIVYQALLLFGLSISVVCFLWILFTKRTGKDKLFWTAFVVLAIIVNRLTENYFIDASYLIYLAQYRKELGVANEILKNKRGDISILQDTV